MILMRFVNSSRNILLTGLAIQIPALLYLVERFLSLGYLPAPFIADKADTFMDFFNPLFWSYRGFYEDWHSVYPPLVPALLKMLPGLEASVLVAPDAFALRESFKFSGWAFFVVFLALLAISLRIGIWRTIPPFTSFLFTVFIGASAPFVFLVERGNLFVLLLPLLSISLDSASRRHIFAKALAMNIKPYFLIAVFFEGARGFAWKRIFVIGVLAFAIFLGFSTVFQLSPFDFFLLNIGYAGNSNLIAGRASISLPFNVTFFAYLFDVAAVKIFLFDQFGSSAGAIKYILYSAHYLFLISVASTAFCFGGRVDRQKASIFCVANIGYFVGGYASLFYVFLIPLFRSEEKNKFALILLLSFFLPWDCISFFSENVGEMKSYLSGKIVSVEWNLGLGIVARPLLTYFLGLLLIQGAFQCRLSTSFQA